MIKVTITVQIGTSTVEVTQGDHRSTHVSDAIQLVEIAASKVRAALEAEQKR